jgi:hypothetical protein
MMCCRMMRGETSVVRRHELLEDPRRDHSGGSIATAKLQDIVPRARQGPDEAHLPPGQDAEQFMHPGRIVIGGQDELFNADQAGGVLPAARLTVDIEAGNVATHDAAFMASMPKRSKKASQEMPSRYLSSQ